LVNDRCKRGSKSESNSSKDIHDKVDPNELSWLERWFSQTDCTKDEGSDASKVASYLEL
jgi:hypothetical protein